MYEHILLPTDGSDAAAQAAPHAIDLAKRYDATLHLLSVVDTAALGPDVRTEVVVGQFEEMAQDAIDDLTERAERAGVSTVTGTVAHGAAHRAICAYADEHDVDLIVMSTHGRSGLGRFLLGSVTEKVIRRASVPVLAIRAAELIDDEE